MEFAVSARRVSQLVPLVGCLLTQAGNALATAVAQEKKWGDGEVEYHSRGGGYSEEDDGWRR